MSQQPPPQQFNYGQGFSNQPDPRYYAPQKQNNTGRNCLIVFLALSALVFVGCIVAAVATGFFVRKAIVELVDEYGNAVMVTAWTSSVTTGEFDEIVCPDSSAEAYSLQFVEDNPNIVSFVIDSIEENKDEESVYISGTITYGVGTGTTTSVSTPVTQTKTYTATFYFKEREGDDSGLSTFGLNCIDVIEGNLQ